MKKYLLSSVILCFAVVMSEAQTIGLTAGVSFPKVKAIIDGGSADLDTKVGFAAGGFANFSIFKNLSIQPELNFIQKGGKVRDFNLEVLLNYVEVPLNILYNAPIGKHRLYIGAGPSIAVAISGNRKYSQYNQKINFGKDDEMQRSEFGGNILAGFQMRNGILAQLNYNKGFSNISNEKWKNSYFSIRLGYLLKNANKK